MPAGVSLQHVGYRHSPGYKPGSCLVSGDQESLQNAMGLLVRDKWASLLGGLVTGSLAVENFEKMILRAGGQMDR